jgi:hypothetical protein
MPHIHVRVQRFLLIVSAVILTSSPLRAAQNNPKLESAYGLPQASRVTEVPRRAEEGRTGVSPGTSAAPSSSAQAQSEQPRQTLPKEAGILQGTDGS